MSRRPDAFIISFVSAEHHWETIYSTKPDDQLSWTQAEPALSLRLIADCCGDGKSSGSGVRVIDVGGGASRLGGRLLEAGFDVTVLDISDAAIQRARQRLGERAAQINWLVADVTHAADLGPFDLWHDRAVFHFLTDSTDRARYVDLLAASLAPGGRAIIATFAEDGPEKCSGLEVRRYSEKSLAAALGPNFSLVKSVPETHVTPWGNPQSFQYSVFVRQAKISSAESPQSRACQWG
jgi:2-polyprenyl-3-methyl-5-hydroxy-6-metoxy-1,4-benzoquinol methylase